MKYRYEIRHIFVKIKFQNGNANPSENKKILSCDLSIFPDFHKITESFIWITGV